MAGQPEPGSWSVMRVRRECGGWAVQEGGGRGACVTREKGRAGEGAGLEAMREKGIAAVLVLSQVKVLISMEAQSHTHTHTLTH